MDATTIKVPWSLNQLHAERARRYLIYFASFILPWYVADPFHISLGDYLQKVVDGEITRLIISAPPQHGKSLLTTQILPAFWLGRNPNLPIIITSYAASLAHKFSRKARDIVEMPDYARVFPRVSTSRTSRAVDSWSIVNPTQPNAYQVGAGAVAAGVGGPITGNPAALGLIDDPFESWADAQSQTKRDHVWDWFKGTFRTRIWEGGAIVIIMTRWHVDDLVGRILKDPEQANKWTILRYPALAETQSERDENNRLLGLPADQPDILGRAPGEPLAPRARFSQKYMEETRSEVGSIVWAAEYQGVPVPRGGMIIKREWFNDKFIEHSKVNRQVRYYDLAVTAKTWSDYTVGVKGGFNGENLIIDHVIRGRWEWPDVRKIIIQTAEMDGHGVEIVVEEVATQTGFVQDLQSILGPKGYRVRGMKLKGQGDKYTRALPWIAKAENGYVLLKRGAWNEPYLDTLCQFTGSGQEHDDDVDATSGLYAVLSEFSAPKTPGVMPVFGGR